MDIEVRNLSKGYLVGKVYTDVLDGLSFNIKKGEVVVILGPSGSGKTTLLNVMSGLDRVSKGFVLYDGRCISKYREGRLTKFIKKNIGFIFQDYNLLPNLSVYENVLLGSRLKDRKDVLDIIELVGLKDHLKSKVFELSGGERQRVAIARGIVKRPKVIFCDELTGALDEKNGKNVLKCLMNVNKKYRMTVVIVTHNPGIALIGDRVIEMNSGHIVSDIKNEKRIDPMDVKWG